MNPCEKWQHSYPGRTEQHVFALGAILCACGEMASPCMEVYVGEEVGDEARAIIEEGEGKIIPMSEWGKAREGVITVGPLEMPNPFYKIHSQSPATNNEGTAPTEKTMNKHPDQTTVENASNDASRMAKYIKDRFVSPKLVRAGKDVGVVISFDGWKPVSFKNEKTDAEETIEKPTYTVEIDAEKYEYSLSVSEARKFEDELRVKNEKPLPEGLIGRKLKWEVKLGKKEYVTSTLLPR